MLSDDERALLRHWTTAGAAGYPLVQRGGQWTWEYRSLRAPRTFDSREDASHNFEGYIAVIVDAARAEFERQYQATPDAAAAGIEIPERDAELLSAAIARSQLSVRDFARRVLVRESRTVFRWLAGENDLPEAVREKCVEILAAGPSEGDATHGR